MAAEPMVIVGAGHAGVSLAFALRDRGWDGAILLLSDEDTLPYHRPPLSKKALASETGCEPSALKAAAAYADAGIALRRGTRVCDVDRAQRSVRLSSGEAIAYHRLALATGSRALTLPPSRFPNAPNVLTLRTHADAARLRAALMDAQKLVVLGGGYIGLEVAATARMMGVDVTVIERAPRLLARIASAPLSEDARRLHVARGVDVRLNAQAATFVVSDERVVAVELSGGERIACDVVLVGIGAAANTDIAAAAEIAVDGGIVVDETARTSDPSIMAVGDCASLPVDGRRIRLESVQNAHDQAKVAAATMLDQSALYHPQPWFWSDQYDVKIQIAGLVHEPNRTVRRPGMRFGGTSFWSFKGAELQAVESLNDAKSHVIARRCLEQGRHPLADCLGDLAYDPLGSAPEGVAPEPTKTSLGTGAA